MTVNRNVRKFSAAAIAAGVIAGVVTITVFLTTNTAEAQDVELREDGVFVTSAQAGDAVAEASQRVGFEIKLPSFVPKGLKLDYIDSSVGPEGVPNAFRLATVSYGPKDEANRGRTSIKIEQTLRMSEPDGRARMIDTGVPGLEVYSQATDRAIGYWVLTANRGFLVTVTGSEPTAEAAMLEMIKSLVE